MHWKTIAGLAAMALFSVGVALLFKRDAQPPPAEQIHTAQTRPYDHRSRGSIVPLPSDEPHAATAFLAAPGSERTNNTEPRALDGIPTIRRQGASPNREAGPQLDRTFPTPLGLLGIDPRKRDSQEDAPTIVEHIIADGDTLPSLAQRYLGDAARAAEIYAANRQVLGSPDLLPIGAKILVPAAPSE